MSKGRPGRRGRLEEEGMVELVAELYCDGFTRKQIAEAVAPEQPPSTDTISRWLKDDRVREIAAGIMNERSHRIRRHVDKRIEGILTNDQSLRGLSVRDLVEIRKAFAPTVTAKEDLEKKKFDAALEAFNLASENPDIVKKLQDGE